MIRDAADQKRSCNLLLSSERRLSSKLEVTQLLEQKAGLRAVHLQKGVSSCDALWYQRVTVLP